MLRAFNEAFLAARHARIPRGEAAAHARAAALMHELGARVFYDRLVAHPVRFDAAEYAELATAATLLLRAQVKILQHLRKNQADVELLAAFAMPAHLAPFLRWDNLDRPDETIARLDLIPTATGYAFCELNVFPGVGGGEAYRAMTEDTSACPLRSLAATYIAQCRRHQLSRVVILDSVRHGSVGYPRQLLLEGYLANAGLEVHLLDEATYPTAWLAPGAGARTLVHRMFTYEEVSDFGFVERLWQSGVQLAGFESELRMSKRFLALMCDPQFQALLDTDELAAIARFVPASFGLDDARLADALRDRADYVFKWDASASYGGAGVLIGAEHTADELEAKLRAAGVDRWICQQALEAETLPLRTPDDTAPADYRIVLGLYSYGGTPSGMMLRGSRASRVVNVSNASGRLGWAFPVSDLSASEQS